MMHLAVNFRHLDPSKGGAETYVADLINRLAAMGHQIDLYAESWVEDSIPKNVKTIRIAAPGFTKWAQILNFARNSEAVLRVSSFDCSIGFINTWYHDVIIPQGGLRQASLEHNAKRYRRGLPRSIYQISKQLDPKRLLYRQIERTQYDVSRNVHVVAVSRFVARHLVQYQGVPESQISIIPNAIDASRLQLPDSKAARVQFRTRLGVPSNTVLGLFLAHNYSLKGLEPLLRAFERFQRQSPLSHRFQLAICGGGKPKPFQKLARALKIDHLVQFVGRLDDVRPAFYGSDFFVMPSYYDPCSLVVFEALACGLPVITSAWNGAGELINEGREGYVISTPDHLEELSQKFTFLEDDQRRAKMSDQARILGQSQSFENHLSQLLSLFERIARHRSRAQSRNAA